MEKWKLKPSGDLGLSPIERYRSLKRESGLVETVLRFCWWTTMRFYLAIFHRLEVNGRENLPVEPPYILASNHSSHLDTMVLGSILPSRLRNHVFPLAAGDFFFDKPANSAFTALFINALPIWRDNFSEDDLAILRKLLIEEKSIFILFPEGTRSRDGKMAMFKHGIGMFVAGTSVPVIPCYLKGAFDAFPYNRALPRFSKLSLSIGVPLNFNSVSDEKDGWSQVAADVEASVRQLMATNQQQ